MYRYYSWQSINFSGIHFHCLEKHDLWKVIQVTLGTLYTKKQGQREILSSWLIKCVVGGVICHSPVVNPRWGRVKLLVDAFLWSALAPSTLNPQVWNAGLADASLVALWKPTDWQKLKAWCLEFEIYDWLGPILYPIAWNFDPWGSHWWLPRMTIVEFLIKIIDEHKTWITWVFPMLPRIPFTFFMLQKWDVSCK